MLKLARFCCLALVLALAGCKTSLYSGLTEREANDMLAVLLSNGIEATKEQVGDTGVTLQVADDDVLAALDVLSRHGFPRETRSTLGSVFEKSGIMSSPFEERVRFIYALGEEVSRTLSEIDGVVTARVHVVMAKEAEMGRPPRPSSAAVFIKHVADRNLEVFVPQIRRLVSNSIEGVSYEDVTVLLMPAEQMQPLVTAVRPATESVFGIEVDRADADRARMIATAALGTLALLVALNLATLLVVLRRRKGQAALPPPAEVAAE